MEIIYVAALASEDVIRSIQGGQFDDLEGPAHRILMDDDSVEAGKQAEEEKNGK